MIYRDPEIMGAITANIEETAEYDMNVGELQEAAERMYDQMFNEED